MSLRVDSVSFRSVRPADRFRIGPDAFALSWTSIRDAAETLRDFRRGGDLGMRCLYSDGVTRGSPRMGWSGRWRSSSLCGLRFGTWGRFACTLGNGDLFAAGIHAARTSLMTARGVGRGWEVASKETSGRCLPEGTRLSMPSIASDSVDLIVSGKPSIRTMGSRS